MLLLGETDKDYRFCLVFKRKMKKNCFVPGDIDCWTKNPIPFKRIDGLVPIEELKEKVAIIELEVEEVL